MEELGLFSEGVAREARNTSRFPTSIPGSSTVTGRRGTAPRVDTVSAHDSGLSFPPTGLVKLLARVAKPVKLFGSNGPAGISLAGHFSTNIGYNGLEYGTHSVRRSAAAAQTQQQHQELTSLSYEYPAQ